MPVSGQDFPREKFAGDEAERGSGVREGHEAVRCLAQFAEDGLAVTRDGLVADLPGRRLELRVAGDELGCFVSQKVLPGLNAGDAQSIRNITREVLLPV